MQPDIRRWTQVRYIHFIFTTIAMLELQNVDSPEDITPLQYALIHTSLSAHFSEMEAQTNIIRYS